MVCIIESSNFIWGMSMNRNGFTLIELLVVIAIIALLLAILMPSLNIAKEKAAGVVCLSNLGNMGMAWHVYCSENNQKMVSARTETGSDHWVHQPLDDNGNIVNPADTGIDEEVNGIRAGALYPYLKDFKVYHCPGDKRSAKSPKHGGSGKGGYRTYSIPAGMNGYQNVIKSLKKVTQLRSTDTKYIFVEEMDGRGFNPGSWQIFPDGKGWIDPVAIWHNNASTLALADGHAESHKWHGEKVLAMTTDERNVSTSLTDPDDIEDYEFMRRGYAHEGNR